MASSTTVQHHHPIDETFRTIGGVRTRVLEMAGVGAPLICLHGYSDQADTWRPLMRALRRSERHVIAVDMPGFGKAAPLNPGPILSQLDSFVAALVHDVAEQAGRDVFVIGNSLGGVETLRTAGNSDLPIAGIIAISPAGFGHSRYIKGLERFTDRRGGSLVPMIERSRVPMPVVRGAMSVAFRGAACANPLRADREAVRAFANQFRTRADMVRVLGIANDLLDELDSAPPPSVDVPVLLLWGDRDRLTLNRGSQRVCEAIPHTELIVLHGCGHCPQLEAAHRVGKLIGNFVDRQSVTPLR